MIEFLAASLRIATPLLLAALGGILSEQAGVFAVGLEGMMLAGACAAALTAFFSGSAAVGIVAAILGGALVGIAVATVAVRLGADNMVTGLAANMLAFGLTSYAMRVAGHGGRAPSIHLPPLASVLGEPPLTWAALVLGVVLALFLARTQAGLVLRITGENPDAAFAAGANPMRVRMAAVVASGAIAGLGGAVLVLQQVGTFTDGMTGGRGYLALAALIVGRWTPWGAAAACLVFGAAEALELRLQALGIHVSSYVLQMAPYIIALAVLSGLGRATRMPAAIGRPVAQ